MAKALQPKAEIRNTHPLLDHRLAAVRGGWPIIPAVDKKGCFNWPRIANDEQAVRMAPEWRAHKWAGTGVRVEGQLIVYDIDVDIPELADRILDDLASLDADAFNAAVMRGSGRVSVALFFRTDEAVGHLHTKAFTAHPELIPAWQAALALPDTNADEHEIRIAAVKAAADAMGKQKVEIFGRLSKGRHFQYEGRHSEGREYQCADDIGPWSVALADLPLLPLTAGLLANRAEAILIEAGLTEIPAQRDELGDVVYDLTPETMFFPRSGGAGTIEELTGGMERDALNGIYGCLESTLAGSTSRGNCKLYVTTTGRVMVVDWLHDGRKHFMVDDEPAPPFEFDADTAAALRALQPPQQPPPPQAPPQAGAAPPPPRRRARSFYELALTADSRVNYIAAGNWLAQELAFCAAASKGKGGVYSVWPGGQWHRYPLALTSLRTLMQPFAIITEGPRGGRHVRSPVDAWLTGIVRNLDDTEQPINAQLRATTIDGLRFRPDLTEPILEEGKKRYLNIYTPPDHPTDGGDTRVFHDFLAHLIPGEADRHLTWQWIAYKVQHPWEPMFTMMMAAPGTFGTGRGTLGVILGRLLGEEYVQEVNFDELTGRSAAARWTAAAIADKLLILVHEAAGDEDDYKVTVRTAGYERLKLILDVDSESLRTREGKNEMPYQQRSSCSCMMTTNHNNPVRMPMGERRLAVVRNGVERMSKEQRGTVRAWARDEANIGALHRELMATEIDAAFDPQEPPMNAAKEEMVELSKTDVDLAWEVAREHIKGKLFTYSQALMLMRLHGEMERYGMWERIAKRRMTEWAHWLRESASKSRVSYKGNQQVVYVLDKRDRAYFAYDAPPEAITAELDKTQLALKYERPTVVDQQDRAS